MNQTVVGGICEVANNPADAAVRNNERLQRTAGAFERGPE